MHKDLQRSVRTPRARRDGIRLGDERETLRIEPAPDAAVRLSPDPHAESSSDAALHCRSFAVQQWRPNRLLSMLPVAARQRLDPRLDRVAMPLGATLQEAGAPAQSAWFPTTAIVSLLCGNQDGSCTEIAAIGHEGLLGVGIFMGGEGGLHRAVVRSEGHAWRIDAQWLKQEFERGEAATRLLLRYTQTLMMQMAQTAVCNRHHSLEQQLCRWLLGSLDRSPHVELKMTHELIASSLGVRREGITQAAGRLRRRGLIECRRGRIGIIDRYGLETQVCECYAVMKTETARLLPEPPETG